MAEANQKPQIVVSFNNHQEHNPAKSAAAGRPIFDDVEVCEIRFPGDLKCWAVFPAHEAEPNATREAGHVITYAEHYNEQYRKFKSMEQQTVAGTPLSECPFLTEGKRRELRALNIHTAEALASLDGSNLRMLGMGGREWKNQAAAFLAKAAGTADVTKMAAEIEQLKERLAIAEGSNPAKPVLHESGEPEEKLKSIEECTDQELRDFIKEESGKVMPANTGREKLLARAMEIAAELAIKEDKAA
jgi:hypothetical protein